MVTMERRTAPAPRTVARARRTRNGVGRRLANLAAGLALMAAAGYAQTFVPPPEQRTAPLTFTGAVGEEVAADRFTVKVHKVVAAHSTDAEPRVTRAGTMGRRVRTDGIFLVLDVSVTATRDAFRLGSPRPVLLTADGKRYALTDKVSETLTLMSSWVQPGFWSRGALVFEVPPAALPGARLVLSAPAGALVADTGRPEAEIDLGLSAESAADLVDRAKDYHRLVAESE